MQAQQATVGRRAPPLDGLRWLVGARPDPAAAVMVLVFVGIGERFTPETVPTLAKRVAAMGDDVAQIVGLAEPWPPDSSELGASAAAWLEDRQIRFPVAALTPARKEFYVIDGIPDVTVIVDGVIVWRGRVPELTKPELARLVALQKASTAP
jgi:hypothetical protein